MGVAAMLESFLSRFTTAAEVLSTSSEHSHTTALVCQHSQQR